MIAVGNLRCRPGPGLGPGPGPDQRTSASSAPAHLVGDRREEFIQTSSYSWAFLPMVCWLSVMLLATLYLLRYDNHQLAVAEIAIRDLQRNVKFVREQLYTAQLANAKEQGPSPASGSGSDILKCKQKLTTLRNDYDAQRLRAENFGREFKKKEDDLAAMKVDLSKQLREKHVLAKRLGIQLAGEVLGAGK